MAIQKQKGNMYSFVSHTWNPVKGLCSHECSYCYMSAMAKRFPVLNNPLRLNEKELKSKLGTGNFIFIGSSTDFFADDVPSDWIHKTLEHCRKYPDNKYLFQSKNPGRFVEFKESFPVNTVLGTTIETDHASYEKLNISKAPGINDRVDAMASMDGFERMVTIEPIIDFNITSLSDQIRACSPAWVNLGADSGKNGLPEPGADKVNALIDSLKTFTDIHCKDNLARLMG